MLISSDSLKRVVVALLQQGGSALPEAQDVADHLVGANLTGHDSHGVGMLPIYVRNLKSGMLVPNQPVALARQDGSILMFDGQYGYGQSVAKQAMEQALTRCQETGLVLMTLRNAHHIGRIGTYGEQAIAAGCVSLHFVNVTDHSPLVAPYAGSDARFATNPICIAMPGSETQPPLLLDMATSRVALGKVRVALNKGETLKEGLLVDHHGQPSRDPSVMEGYLFPEREDLKPKGALLPMGDYKGYGLAMFCELLGGMLSGGGTIEPGNERRGGIVNNMMTILMDPARLVEPSWMERNVADLVSYFKASPPADPSNPVQVAGDPERATRAAREAQGVPVDDTTWEQILSAMEALGGSRETLLKLAEAPGSA
jgi:uncharacterized oxidoreductase